MSQDTLGSRRISGESLRLSSRYKTRKSFDSFDFFYCFVDFSGTPIPKGASTVVRTPAPLKAYVSSPCPDEAPVFSSRGPVPDGSGTGRVLSKKGSEVSGEVSCG